MKGRTRIRSDEDLSSREVRLARRALCGCSFCPPHGSENASRRPKHGENKPRSRIRRARPPL